MTNFEDAFAELNTVYQEDATNIHIFMTDGAPTVGSEVASELCEYLPSTFEHFFLGFNVNHNSKLLYDLCLRTSSHYYFIDTPENSSLIYGEILHAFLYRTHSLEFKSSGKITFYDYKTNNWLHTYNYGYIGSDDTVSIHFKFDWDTPVEDLTFTINGTQIDTDVVSYSVYDVSTEIDTLYDPSSTTSCSTRNTEVEKYYYRQHVLETLFTCLRNQVYDTTTRTNMEELFEKIKQFCEENELTDDPFMSQLKDDLSMVYTTSQHGNVFDTPYCLARHVSQGAQTAYNVHNINVGSGPRQGIDMFTGINSGPVLTRGMPLLHSHTATPPPPVLTSYPQQQMTFTPSAEDPTHNLGGTPSTNIGTPQTPSILAHVCSRDSTSAYATDHQTQIMNSISENMS